MIETPQPEDVPEIERIARETEAFSSIDFGIVREMLDTFLHPQPRDDHTFIVYKSSNSRILGFACYGPVPLTDRAWDLYWICVERNHQKNGIGRLLLDEIEQEVCRRGARALYVETSDTELYKPARDFYERNKYRCLAHIDDFYAPGDGKVLYRKVFRRT